MQKVSSAENGDWKHNTVSDIVLAIEIILSAVITFVMGYYAKKIVQEKLDQYTSASSLEKEG